MEPKDAILLMPPAPSAPDVWTQDSKDKFLEEAEAFMIALTVQLTLMNLILENIPLD